jgi:predicted RNase H-like HicB family nuclease
MRLVAVVQPTYKGLTKRFSAYCPDIPGCIAHEATAEKALEALKVTVTHQIHAREALGLESIKNYCKVELLEIEAQRKPQNDGLFRSLKLVR